MTVLFIFPHPDDETIFAGGAIARHSANGDKVIWLCASRGERGGDSKRKFELFFYLVFKALGIFTFFLRVQSFVIRLLPLLRKPDQGLAELRKKEAEKAAEVFAIPKPLFLDIEDMRFEKNKKNLRKKISEILARYRPSAVYTLHPNGITGHPDHMALTQAVTEAAGQAEIPDIEILGATLLDEEARKYKLPLLGVSRSEISKTITLNEAELEKKKSALNVYESQEYLWKMLLAKHQGLLEREYFTKLS